MKCRLDEVSADPPSAPPAPLWRKNFDLDAGSLSAALESVPRPVDAVGHRIVHGGSLRQPARLTSTIRSAIAREAEVAPEHNRLELGLIDVAARAFEVPQIAVFDAGFHATLAPPAYVYPGPYEWLDHGIRRYGFHGISHQYASRRAAEMTGARRIVTCHLGNGASLCAVLDGKSVDTTMGFTPLDGLMMGTRCGSLDPGILIYLIRHRGYTAERLDHILNRESGLAGVSGISGDMREILKAIDQGNPRAKLAFDIYTHRLCVGIGAMAAALGGVEAIVFTGGIGENCAPLRDAVAGQVAFLRARILVLPAEEEWEIARECWRFLRGPAGARRLDTLEGAIPQENA